MLTVKIPVEWPLGASRRYKRQNMEKAMRGKIERGLVELITNSDDSYRDLEDNSNQISGKIRIEIERRRSQPSIVIVRDRASGMNRLELYNKLGELGKRTSGFETGKPRRGLHGRGARDIAAFGVVHFESIKNEEYNHLIIPPSLKCRFIDLRPKKATPTIRKKLGINRGNGTVVTIEVENRFTIPIHDKLKEDFSRYYSLRDLFSNSNREVILIDRHKKRKDLLTYTHPAGNVVFNKNFTIPNYHDATAHLIIRKHTTSFEQGILPYREGILVKSASAIHDCTYFGLESEPFSWRFTGELRCDVIDKLVRQYDDKEEVNPDNPAHPKDNPTRLLDPFRDGLIFEHPFTQALYKKCKEIFQPFIDELRDTLGHPGRDVVDESLKKKLDGLSKEISKIFEKKLSDLDEEIPTENIDDPRIKKLSIGLHIIPPGEQPIIANQPKTFSILVKHYEALDETLPINIISEDPENVKVRTSPVFLKKFSEDRTIGASTFTLEGSKIGTEAVIEVRYDGYDNSITAKIIATPPFPELPSGLSFEKPLYHLQLNKEKTIVLRLKTTSKLNKSDAAEIVSDHPKIVVKGGGKCQLRETDHQGVFIGNCKILGRQLKEKGVITARLLRFGPVTTRVIVEERVQPPSGVKLKFDPVEDDFIHVRYKWDNKDPYQLLIGAKHPSIRKYLGEPSDHGYPGINTPLYHAVLAEVIAEALTFRILEKQFVKEGDDGMLDYTSTDTYYHRHFTEFLNVTHKHLVPV